MNEFNEWKNKKLEEIKKDIEYHENKLKKLRMELKIYEA